MAVWIEATTAIIAFLGPPDFDAMELGCKYLAASRTKLVGAKHGSAVSVPQQCFRARWGLWDL
jgi:hypothetical protein